MSFLKSIFLLIFCYYSIILFILNHSKNILSSYDSYDLKLLCFLDHDSLYLIENNILWVERNC